ncbi:hypothetical protein TNCV_3479371 [Trichonephila clavipes]|nr:hypothetical protein TNCV_3479371 [Trichonephila clavipes]
MQPDLRKLICEDIIRVLQHEKDVNQKQHICFSTLGRESESVVFFSAPFHGHFEVDSNLGSEEGGRLKEYNERVGRHSTSRNAESVALLSECVRKDRRRTLEQMVRLHTSRRRHLKEFIRRKRPQFWQIDVAVVA